MTGVLALGGRPPPQLAALVRALPFAVFIGLMAAGPWLASLLPDDFDGRWLYGLRCLLAAMLLLVFRPHFGELRWALRPGRREAARALAVGLGVLVLWLTLSDGFFVLGEPGTGFVPLRADGGLDWPLVAMRLAGSVLLVPVMEELFWRSLIMRWLEAHDFSDYAPARVGLRALLLSSFVFGFEHSQWLAGCFAGLAYGWLYIRSGNLWSPVIAHGCTNLLLGIWVLATGAWNFW